MSLGEFVPVDDWREQDAILQRLAALADSDEHVCCAADVERAVTDTMNRLKGELARLRIELQTSRDSERHWKRIAHQKAEQLEALQQAVKKPKGDAR